MKGETEEWKTRDDHLGVGGCATSTHHMLDAATAYAAWTALNDPASFDAHGARDFFASTTPLPAAVISVYLVLVHVGPHWMASRPPFQLQTTARVWNVFVALFSVMGAYYCVPHLASQIWAHGFWFSTCADVYELAGSGHVALWAVLFTWSKLFELFDTALLVLRKRKLITLHWFHHASVIAFAWAAWIYETPCALWYGAMNYSVHAVMYTYFLLTALPSCRASALRFAPLITSLQISQFAWGTVINVFAAVCYFTPAIGCAIRPQILQIGALMYLLYGALFVQLFWRRYVRPPPAGKSAISGVVASGRAVETGMPRPTTSRDADLLLKVV